MNGLPAGCYICVQQMTTGSCVELDETESHHLLHVARTERGSVVTLLNGEGVCAQARLMEVQKKIARLRIERLTIVMREKPSVSLAVSVPRNESAFEAILRMSAEFGVERVVPLMSARSESYRIVKRADRMERWKKVIRNACKQSRTAWFPTLSAPLPIHDLLDQIDGSKTIVLAGIEPQYASAHPVNPAAIRDADEVFWIVGPEGGWTEGEADRLKAGCTAISFGQSILTSVTASVAGLGVVRFLSRNNLE